MLERLDIDKILSVAQEKGVAHLELYAEHNQQTQIRIRGRLPYCSFHVSEGVALRYSLDGASHHACFVRPTTEEIIALLKGAKDSTSASSPNDTARTPALTPSMLRERMTKLHQLARQAWGEGDAAFSQFLDYHDELKTFYVVRADGKRSEGREERAHVKAEWLGAHPKGLVRWECHSNSIQRLVDSLSNATALKEKYRQSQTSSPLWPAPMGELPLYWSANAMANLLLPLVRTFEGDLFLNQDSFLARLPETFQVGFDLVDDGLGNCDVEGTDQKPLTFFQQGRPRGLACHARLAEQLDVESTGHARRESFEVPPTVGLRNVRLAPLRPEAAILSTLDQGISVREIEVTHFNPQTSEMEIRMLDCSLIHLGQEGERIEPFTFQTDLLSLLPTMRAFSNEVKTVGFRIFKRNQSFITELTLPSAISFGQPIPGSVPPNHYW